MNEYLLQGMINGNVDDCLTAYGYESAKEKAYGNWSKWFDEIVVYDITAPLNPTRIYI